MNNASELRKELRSAKNALLKITKVLLHELEQAEHPDAATQREMQLLHERAGYLEAEIWSDINDRLQTADSGKLRLQNALDELKQQLAVERELFERDGKNADKLLDLNFRVQEIEDALNDRK